MIVLNRIQRLPFERWPIPLHLGGIAVMLAVVAALSWGWARHKQQQLVRQTAEWSALRARLQGMQAPLPSSSVQLASQLPAAKDVQNVLRDIVGWAKTHALRIESLEVQSTASTPQTWGHISIPMSVQAEYAPFKAWLGDLLARYPGLTVQTLTLHPQAASSGGPVEAQLTMQVFVRD